MSLIILDIKRRIMKIFSVSPEDLKASHQHWLICMRGDHNNFTTCLSHKALKSTTSIFLSPVLTTVKIIIPLPILILLMSLFWEINKFYFLNFLKILALKKKKKKRNFYLKTNIFCKYFGWMDALLLYLTVPVFTLFYLLPFTVIFSEKGF